MQFPKPTPEYSHLTALTGDWDVVYGPVPSRRLGKSLGINLLGQEKKICSYDCPYCDLGSTVIRMNEIKKSGYFESVPALAAKIRDGFSKHYGEKIDAITIVGNGEPTLYPDFDEIAAEIIKLRDEIFPRVPVGVMTNGSQLDNKKVLKGVSLLDLKMLKLDAGNDKTLKKINAPLVKDTIESLITNARKLKNVILQSCFVEGAVANTANEDIEEWIEAVGMVKPDIVHIYTIDRVPATSGLIRPEEDTLYTIAAKLEKRTRIKWKVYY